MISSFKFEGYKIDSIEMQMKPEVEMVRSHIGPNFKWNINLEIRKPFYFTGPKVYIGGLNLRADMFPPELPNEQHVAGQELVALKIGIVGAFSSDGKFTKEVEDSLVRVQIPSLLLPYLRSMVSNVTVSSGFGAVIVPLINMHKWAETQTALEVGVVEAAELPPSLPQKS